MRKTGKIIVCKICSKKKYYAAWHLKKGGSYCSKECNLIALKGNTRGNHPNAIATRFKKGQEPINPKNGKLLNCLNCDKQFYSHLKGILNRKYCSQQCYWKNKHDKPWNKTDLTVTCKYCDKSFHVSQSKLRKNNGNCFCSKMCFDKHQTGRPNGRAGIALPHLRGKNSSNWQGGKTKEVQRARGSIEYKIWRNAVYKRDDWTCQKCFKRGGKLNADHIKPFALFPELRFELSNGRTLCWDCHRETETFGSKLRHNKSLFRNHIS